MLRVLAREIALACSAHLRTNRHRPRQAGFRPCLENLEGRLVLSNVVHDPSYDNGWWQPLNGDTSYSITGDIGTDYTLQQYAFYASKGNNIVVTATVSATNLISMDGRIVVSEYGVGYASQAFFGSQNSASVSFAAPGSGMYVIQLENDYSDPSTVQYFMQVSGADKPSLAVTSPSSTSSTQIPSISRPTLPCRRFRPRSRASCLMTSMERHLHGRYPPSSTPQRHQTALFAQLVTHIHFNIR